MKLTLEDSEFIKTPVSIISDLVTEAKFEVDKNGMELRAMDPANVAMVIFKLLSSAFSKYDIDKKDKIEFGINLNNLKQVLKRASANETITFELTDNKLKVVINGKSTRTFILHLIDLDEEEKKAPDLQFKTIVTLPSSIMDNAIGDVGIVGESVKLESSKSKLMVSSSGDLNKAEVEISQGDNVNIICDENSKSKYSIEYLKKMIQGSKLSEQTTLKFNSDYPLKLEYNVVDKVSLAFILAPRVDND